MSQKARANLKTNLKTNPKVASFAATEAKRADIIHRQCLATKFGARWRLLQCLSFVLLCSWRAPADHPCNPCGPPQAASGNLTGSTAMTFR